MDGTRGEAASQTAEFSRRTFLSSVVGGLLVALGFTAATARGSAGPLYVGCRADDAEGYFTTGFGGNGHVAFDIAVARAEVTAQHSPRLPAQCVVLARPTGTFAVVIDIDRGEALRRIDAAAGRHFYGHGAFSPDGRYLFTTENDFKTGRGMIGIRDAQDGYRQVGEFASPGVARMSSC